MAIPAVRFESLDADFNIASTSFDALIDDAVLNAPLESYDDLINQNQELLDQLKDLDQDILAPGFDALKACTRFTQDIFDTFSDFAKLPETYITGYIDDLFPDMGAMSRNKLKTMAKVCRNKAMGRSAGFGNNLGKLKCDGMTFGQAKCSPTQASGIIGQAALGAIGQVQKLFGNILKEVLALANLGFGANLCGVFSAVTQGITDKNILTSAAGILLNQQGSQGNLMGVFDIAKNLNNLPISFDFPNTIKNIAQNAVVPFGNFQNNVFQMADRVTGSLEAVAYDWDVSGDGLKSVAKLGTKNQGLNELFAAKASDQSLDIAFLDTIQTAPDSGFCRAYGNAPSLDMMYDEEEEEDMTATYFI